jgi:hypothetical protein
VVAMGGSLSSRAAVRRPSRPEPAREPSALSRVPVSVIALIVAAGVFVSSMGYADGRAGAGSHSMPGIRLFWIGQALILIPVAGRLLSRRQLSNGGTVTLIAVVTVAEYLIKVNYTPLGFGFNDEFLHWRNTTNMLATGQLFEANYGLPVGTAYPGLEEATSALVSATGLSVFEAGLIVAGIAHLLFICFLYLAFCVAIRSHRIAGIAVLLYTCTPSLTSFNSMFIYETLALAFLAMCIVAGLRSSIDKTPRERNRWFIIAVLCIFATVLTHHVTSYMLTAFLILVAIASRLTGSRNTAIRFGILATISAVSVIVWIATYAKSTIPYFAPIVTGVIKGLNSISTGTAAAPSTIVTPRTNQVLQYGGLLIITVLILIGAWQAWRRHRRHPWIIGMMIGCLGFFGFIVVRIADPNGQELAGRSATYTYIPVSVVAALALTKLVNSGPVRRWGAAVTGVVLASVVTLLIDGLANGWPPFWERLPGPHQVSSFESSIGPEEIAVSEWTLAHLGPGNAIAADAGTYPLLLGYGDQNALQNISFLYATPNWTPGIANEAAYVAGAHYVLTDSRLTKQLPLNGTYFPGDKTDVTATLSPASLDKFNHITGVSRVFDDGTIVIYDLQSLGYVPQKP